MSTGFIQARFALLQQRNLSYTHTFLASQNSNSRASALRTIRNPQSKSLPRASGIPEPRPVLQLRIRVSRRDTGFNENPSLFAALQVSGPRAPLDWFEVRA
jgi:hypothetical protein